MAKGTGKLPLPFVDLWKAAINKCFINHNSSIQRRISTGLCLGDWIDQEVNTRWTWWSVPSKPRIYRHSGEAWTFYSQRRRRYYLNDAINECPLEHALQISISTVANSFKIEGPVAEFRLLPPVNTVSDFKDDAEWSTLAEGFANASADPTI